MVFERKPVQQMDSINNEIIRSMNDNTRRIRALEQSLDSSRSRITSLEERMIDEMGDIKKWLDQLSLDIKEISNEIKMMRSEILRVNKELEKTAKKTEVKELESLIDIYNPIKSHFVTKEEVFRMMERGLNKV